MAALEAKIQQYERDVDHLKRALERSDQYVDDLESRVKKAEKRQLEAQEAFRSNKGAAEAVVQQQKISMMMRSLSDSERVSICSNPEAESQAFQRNQSLVFMPSAERKDPAGEQNNEDAENTSDFLPSTPSSAFRSLTLRSPTIREKKVSFKPVTFLRRLDFEESPRKTPGSKFSSLEKFPKALHLNNADPSKSVFWDLWQSSHEPSRPGPSKKSEAGGSSSSDSISEEPDSFQTASEAFMDAAYLDKISELDSMMLDGESSSSRGSQLSWASSPQADLDGTLVPEPKTCLSDAAKPEVQGGHQNQCPDDCTGRTSDTKEARTGSEEEASSAQVSVTMSGGSAERAGPSHTEELSFDLLFDPLDEVRIGSLSPVTQNQDQVNPSSSPGSNPENTRERAAVNSSQPTKRKSHSPFSMNSPTKLSKLM